MTEFVEKPAPDQIDTNNISAGVYVLERSVLALPAGGRRRVDRARRLPRPRRRRALRARGPRLLEGHRDARALPRGDVRHPRGLGRDRGRRAHGHELRVRRSRASKSAGRIVPAALVEAGCRIADGARIGGRAVLERGVVVGEGTTIEGSVVMEGTEIGAHCTLRGCIVAGGVRIGDHCVIDGMSVLGAGVTLGADNVVSNGARLFPGVTLPAGALQVLMTTLNLDARLRRRHHRATRRGARAGRAPARRAVARGLLRRAAGGRAGRRDRRRHGRLGRRRAAGAGRARHAAGAAVRASPTATRCPAGPGPARWCCARATPGATEETLAAYEDAAARGAPRIVATTGGPLAARAREDGVPGDPAARRLPAAGGDRLLPRRRPGGGVVGRRRAFAAGRDRGARRTSPSGSRPSGARTATTAARPRRSRARCTGPCR